MPGCAGRSHVLLGRKMENRKRPHPKMRLTDLISLAPLILSLKRKHLPVLYSRLAMASLASLVLLVLVIGGALFFVSSESLAAWLPTTTATDSGGITYVQAAPPVVPINQPEGVPVPLDVGPAPSEETGRYRAGSSHTPRSCPRSLK